MWHSAREIPRNKNIQMLDNTTRPNDSESTYYFYLTALFTL